MSEPTHEMTKKLDISRPSLSKCLDLLRYHREDEFLALVGPTISALINKKPWPHGQSEYSYSDSQYHCAQCHAGRAVGQTFACPCPVPPRLTDPPEVLAFRLRDKVWTGVYSDDGPICNVKNAKRAVLDRIWEVQQLICAKGSPWVWVGWEATPCEQILCCLLVLGAVEDGPEGS